MSEEENVEGNCPKGRGIGPGTDSHVLMNTVRK